VKQVITTFIIVFLLVSSSYAEKPRTLAVYKQHNQSPDHDKGNFDHLMHHMLYLSGVADAYTLMNKQRVADEHPLLYCQPGDVTLNGNDYIRILEQRVYHPDTPLPDHLTVSEALLLSLQDEFPCN
jgi:hypothetical protein